MKRTLTIVMAVTLAISFSMLIKLDDLFLANGGSYWATVFGFIYIATIWGSIAYGIGLVNEFNRDKVAVNFGSDKTDLISHLISILFYGPVLLAFLSRYCASMVIYLFTGQENLVHLEAALALLIWLSVFFLQVNKREIYEFVRKNLYLVKIIFFITAIILLFLATFITSPEITSSAVSEEGSFWGSLLIIFFMTRGILLVIFEKERFRHLNIPYQRLFILTISMVILFYLLFITLISIFVTPAEMATKGDYYLPFVLNEAVGPMFSNLLIFLVIIIAINILAELSTQGEKVLQTFEDKKWVSFEAGKSKFWNKNYQAIIISALVLMWSLFYYLQDAYGFLINIKIEEIVLCVYAIGFIGSLMSVRKFVKEKQMFVKRITFTTIWGSVGLLLIVIGYLLMSGYQSLLYFVMEILIVLLVAKKIINNKSKE